VIESDIEFVETHPRTHILQRRCGADGRESAGGKMEVRGAANLADGTLETF
jgi:hypothetical protein